MLTYRAAVLVVAAAIIKVAMARHSGSDTCQNLSPVLSACHALSSVVKTPSTYGGAVSNNVLTLEYFKVWTTVGKKLVIDAADTLPNKITSCVTNNFTS